MFMNPAASQLIQLVPTTVPHYYNSILLGGGGAHPHSFLPALTMGSSFALNVIISLLQKLSSEKCNEIQNINKPRPVIRTRKNSCTQQTPTQMQKQNNSEQPSSITCNRCIDGFSIKCCIIELIDNA